jgi:hypothetical protein
VRPPKTPTEIPGKVTGGGRLIVLAALLAPLRCSLRAISFEQKPPPDPLSKADRARKVSAPARSTRPVAPRPIRGGPPGGRARASGRLAALARCVGRGIEGEGSKSACLNARQNRSAGQARLDSLARAASTSRPEACEARAFERERLRAHTVTMRNHGGGRESGGKAFSRSPPTASREGRGEPPWDRRPSAASEAHRACPGAGGEAPAPRKAKRASAVFRVSSHVRNAPAPAGRETPRSRVSARCPTKNTSANSQRLGIMRSVVSASSAKARRASVQRALRRASILRMDAQNARGVPSFSPVNFWRNVLVNGTSKT